MSPCSPAWGHPGVRPEPWHVRSVLGERMAIAAAPPPPRPGSGGTVLLGAQPLICTISLAPGDYAPRWPLARGATAHLRVPPPRWLSGRARGSFQCRLPIAMRLNWGNRTPRIPWERHPIPGLLSRRGYAAGEWLPSRGAMPEAAGTPSPATPEVAPGFCPSLRWPPRTPAPLRHPLLSLHRHVSPLSPPPQASYPTGTPLQVSPPWGLPSRWGETSPPAPGRAKSCTQDHRFPPPAGDAQADHTKGAAMPPDQAIPLSPRAVLGLCPFATGTASLWAPQPGAAPHPQPGAGCPFPLTCFHILQPPTHPLGAHWVPGPVPTAAAEPLLPLPPPPMATPASLQPLQARIRGA